MYLIEKLFVSEKALETFNVQFGIFNILAYIECNWIIFRLIAAKKLLKSET